MIGCGMLRIGSLWSNAPRDDVPPRAQVSMRRPSPSCEQVAPQQGRLLAQPERSSRSPVARSDKAEDATCDRGSSRHMPSSEAGIGDCQRFSIINLVANRFKIGIKYKQQNREEYMT
jgi:hypothetical protein